MHLRTVRERERDDPEVNSLSEYFLDGRRSIVPREWQFHLGDHPLPLPDGAEVHCQPLWGLRSDGHRGTWVSRLADRSRGDCALTGEAHISSRPTTSARWAATALKPIIFVLNNRATWSNGRSRRIGLGLQRPRPLELSPLPAALGCGVGSPAEITTLGELDAALARALRGNRVLFEVVGGRWTSRPVLAMAHQPSTPCTRMIRAPERLRPTSMSCAGQVLRRQRMMIPTSLKSATSLEAGARDGRGPVVVGIPVDYREPPTGWGRRHPARSTQEPIVAPRGTSSADCG